MYSVLLGYCNQLAIGIAEEKIIVPDKESGNMLNLLNLNTGKKESK